MNEIKIECPACKQPIGLGLPAQSPFWKMSTLVLFLVAIGLGILLVVSHRSAKQRDVELLRDYDVAMRATRANVFREAAAGAESVLLDYDNRVIQSLQEHKGLTDERMMLDAWQSMFYTFTNRLAENNWGKVKLSGTVVSDGRYDCKVQTDGSDYDSTWPILRNGQWAQGSFFLLAGRKDIGPTTKIRGTGTNPLPWIFTNNYGELMIELQYDYQAD